MSPPVPRPPAPPLLRLRRAVCCLAGAAVLLLSGVAAQAGTCCVGAWGNIVPAAIDAAPTMGSVRFAPGRAALPADAHPILDRLASRLDSNRGSRVELLAYASGSNEESRARRLSLDRALVVRDYLTARGVSRSRVILRPLGNHPPEADRVDVVSLEQ